ncbi:MAG: biotin--[acetyl-CoA-carboxylase] ligase [Muribaculaceae bacterium]|nr:biotin--[acetyl-CoA-carboxylase] ligase [Muribaculaceae bacterium]
MNVIVLPRVDSTSTYMRQELVDAPAGTVVVTDCQSAGRGQRGNSWEAEPGANLTFSVLLRPEGIDASTQYAVSEAVALAIVESLDELVPDAARLAIKWPNDIYYDDRKICGILIENTLTGMAVNRSIAGIGININQTRFVSDAPNPVSLSMLTGETYELRPLLDRVVTRVLDRVAGVATTAGRCDTAADYMARLWRRDGLHPYLLPDGTRFDAAIEGVAPTGHLTLRHADGTATTHAFKEVAFVI